MLRGTSLFICDDCKNRFMGLDVEWNCTPLSAPQQCIKCGSWHTMPDLDLDFLDRELYEKLWKRGDETGNHTVTCAYRIDELENCIKRCDEWNSTDHTKELEEMDEEEAKRKDSPKTETFLDQCGIALLLILYLPFYLYDCVKERYKSKITKG